MRKTLGLPGHAADEHMTPALFAALSGQPSDDAHLLLDAEGVIVEASGACQRVLGRDAGALSGIPLADLSAVDSTAQCRAWLAVTDATGFDRRETRLHRPDGSFVDVELTLTRPADGGPVVVLEQAGFRLAATELRYLTLRSVQGRLEVSNVRGPLPHRWDSPAPALLTTRPLLTKVPPA